MKTAKCSAEPFLEKQNMKDKIRLGLYGSNGHQINHKLTDHPDAELVAVSKLSAAAMENLPETVRIYESLDAMLRDPEYQRKICGVIETATGRFWTK